MPATPLSLFAGLVDDAALFPPGNAPMDVALRAHAQHRAASYVEMVGSFLCPVSRIDELAAALPDDQQVELPGRGRHRGDVPPRAAGGLASRDSRTLVAAVRGWSESDALDVRRLLRSLGCCGVTDPPDELAELDCCPLSQTEE